MKLAVEVEREGKAVPVEVDTELESSVDTFRVVRLVGAEPLAELARGEWNPEAARAIIYVNLVRALADGEPDWDNPPFLFSAMDLDWGELTPYMDTDPEMEATLADLSEEADEDDDDDGTGGVREPRPSPSVPPSLSEAARL